jgi:hypothetical protein
MLRDAMESEMDSLTNCLRNTFLGKIPTEAEIGNACGAIADKLSGGNAAKNEAKLALMDILDEALGGKTFFFFRIPMANFCAFFF